MQKISKIALIKHGKELNEIIRLGKKYDKEKDPDKKAALKEEIERRCEEFKRKVNPDNKSGEELKEALCSAIEAGSADDTETDAEAAPLSETEGTETDSVLEDNPDTEGDIENLETKDN